MKSNSHSSFQLYRLSSISQLQGLLSKAHILSIIYYPNLAKANTEVLAFITLKLPLFIVLVSLSSVSFIHKKNCQLTSPSTQCTISILLFFFLKKLTCISQSHRQCQPSSMHDYQLKRTQRYRHYFFANIHCLFQSHRWQPTPLIISPSTLSDIIIIF